MSARSFKSVGWVAGIGAAALTCYMFSLSVAAERAELTQLEGEIVQLQRSIRTLNTELGTRARVNQLQHWASADFGFTAPAASQFLENEVTLAQLEVRPETSPMEAPVVMANAQPPAPAMPRVVQASASSPAPAPARPSVTNAAQPRTQGQAQAAAQPLVRQASVTRTPLAAAGPRNTARTVSTGRAGTPATTPQPASRTPSRAPVTAARATTPAPRAATRATSLLNERTLRDLNSRERAERGDRAARGGR